MQPRDNGFRLFTEEDLRAVEREIEAAIAARDAAPAPSSVECFAEPLVVADVPATGPRQQGDGFGGAAVETGPEPVVERSSPVIRDAPLEDWDGFDLELSEEDLASAASDTEPCALVEPAGKAATADDALSEIGMLFVGDLRAEPFDAPKAASSFSALGTAARLLVAALFMTAGSAAGWAMPEAYLAVAMGAAAAALVVDGGLLRLPSFVWGAASGLLLTLSSRLWMEASAQEAQVAAAMGAGLFALWALTRWLDRWGFGPAVRT